VSQKVLVVDDDAALLTVLKALLLQAGLSVHTAADAHAALAHLETHPVDLVLTDLRMPGLDGLGLLDAVRARDPSIPVVLLTAHGSVPLAVEAMRRGAADFVQKPFDRDELLFCLQKALAVGKEAAFDPRGREQAATLRALEERIDRAAASAATVLVTGESGTGKEVVARAIHARSPRAKGPFVAVHCAALPDALLESELFGYERGAFTGATQRKPGRVELAAGGTLFLDEIGDVTPLVQVKLLRLLQERTFDRLGGTASQRADVRFVAATHRDLAAMAKTGAFREDLFYRLAVVPIELPPLRARRAEIPRFCREFCADHARAAGKALSFDESALALLGEQPWPGNIRQLQNFVERLVVLSDGPVLTARDVGRELEQLAPVTHDAPLDEARKGAERVAVVDALARAQGNRTRAARLLGVSRRTLYNKLAEHGLD